MTEIEDFIKKNFVPVEDKPGFVWFSKRKNGDWSDEHGIMEYERVPSDVEYIIYYDIDWDEDI